MKLYEPVCITSLRAILFFTDFENVYTQPNDCFARYCLCDFFASFRNRDSSNVTVANLPEFRREKNAPLFLRRERPSCTGSFLRNYAFSGAALIREMRCRNHATRAPMKNVSKKHQSRLGIPSRLRFPPNWRPNEKTRSRRNAPISQSDRKISQEWRPSAKVPPGLGAAGPPCSATAKRYLLVASFFPFKTRSFCAYKLHGFPGQPSAARSYISTLVRHAIRWRGSNAMAF